MSPGGSTRAPTAGDVSIADVVLRDGSTLRIRPVEQDDRERLVRFLRSLSQASLRLRYFSGAVDLEGAAKSAIEITRDGCALVATRGFDAEIVAHAGYGRIDADRAEVAFAVADELQGHGVGTIMLAHLAGVAAETGISFFEAEVLPENHRMIDVFRESGFDVRTRSEPGVVIVDFPTELTPQARTRFEEREQLATAAALSGFLNPGSVAVIGASRRRGTPGGDIFHNLLEGGFSGAVYPVNRAAETVQSVHAYPSMLEVPGPVDLAVIAIPGDAVLDAARDCAAKGVQRIVVISAGFAEVGPDGARRQKDLLELCRAGGMRMIGPNCLGLLNTDPRVRLNASFAPAFPPRGHVGFMSQSGALGIAVVQQAERLGIGLSSFVSAGNKADISGNDLLRYWAGDDETDVILLYLESFGNPRRFARIAPEIARRKPVLAVKSGRSVAGSRAAGSHTGALLAASDVTVDALFRQAGVIRADTLSELFDVARVLSSQPPPLGKRVAVVTNAGGPAILCADACAARGLEVPPLPEHVQEELRSFLPPAAAVANPVDMLATASPDQYARTARVLLKREVADAVIAIFVPPLSSDPDAVAAALRETVAASAGEVPLLSVFMTAADVPVGDSADPTRIPGYAYPEQAAAALAAAVRYGEWRSREPGEVRRFDGLRSDEAAALIASALADGREWLTPREVLSLLDCYGFPLAEWRLVTSARAAGAAARALAGPVVLKGIAPGLLHKSDVGAVQLGLSGGHQVERAARDMAQRLGDSTPLEFLVQRMADPGVEMLVGVVHDPLFGPVLACGAGGTAAELLGDVAVRLTPLTDRDAGEMIRSLRTYALLRGFRGSAPTDIGALEEIVLRLSAMVETHEEIAELDLNPVIVSEGGAVVVDARLKVQAPPPRRPFPSLD